MASMFFASSLDDQVTADVMTPYCQQGAAMCRQAVLQLLLQYISRDNSLRPNPRASSMKY